MAAYQNISDDELLNLVKVNDRKAYAQIFDRYQAVLFRYTCKLTKDEEDAADIVQDIFFALWNKRQEIELTSSLSAYLYTAVRYKFFNLLEHKKIRTDYAESMKNFIATAEVQPDHHIREKQLIAFIENKIRRLPPKMRQIFELSRKNQLSHREIAIQLEISEKTVKKQINNTLRFLRLKV